MIKIYWLHHSPGLSNNYESSLPTRISRFPSSCEDEIIFSWSSVAMRVFSEKKLISKHASCRLVRNVQSWVVASRKKAFDDYAHSWSCLTRTVCSSTAEFIVPNRKLVCRHSTEFGWKPPRCSLSLVALFGENEVSRLHRRQTRLQSILVRFVLLFN